MIPLGQGPQRSLEQDDWRLLGDYLQRLLGAGRPSGMGRPCLIATFGIRRFGAPKLRVVIQAWAGPKILVQVIGQVIA